MLLNLALRRIPKFCRFDFYLEFLSVLTVTLWIDQTANKFTPDENNFGPDYFRKFVILLVQIFSQMFGGMCKEYQTFVN